MNLVFARLKAMQPSSVHSPDPHRAFSRRKPAVSRCPNCHRGELAQFYAANNIPVHSTLQMRTRDEALSIPAGELALGSCPECAFISNMRFDEALIEYSPQCEESQAFSPTFNTFAKQLAQSWIDAHALRGKRILEIGCGKGEFLSMFCELAQASGVGVDPTFDPNRAGVGVSERVRFIPEFYTDAHSDLQADCIICRHTLEHIAKPLEFLSMIRRTIGQRRDTVVLFELPDVTRILREGAFWDVYYEHCSYFTAGSLARLFRAAGFKLIDLKCVYNQQYLVIAARPADAPTAPALAIENDLPETHSAVRRFGDQALRSIAFWRRMVSDAASRGERVAAWGSLSKGVAFLTTLGITNDIPAVVDINPHRQGRYMPGTGQPIVAPRELVKLNPDHVIVMNPVYLDEISRDLKDLGLAPRLWAPGVEDRAELDGQSAPPGGGAR